jgi:DNA invertase Pin-like site-specific DNA recombinase
MQERNHFGAARALENRDGRLTEAARRRAAAGQRRAAERPPPGAGSNGVPVVGYASVSVSAGAVKRRDLKKQAESIARECERRGLVLLELVGEREPTNGHGLERPGLSYALQRISAREAQGLVVSELSRLSHSAADLGTIIQWFTRAQARLVAVAETLDTEYESGRLAANMLVEVSGWERKRISQRTRKGLEAARLNGRGGGRPAVSDNPELRDRIRQMRSQGMTLQGIADQLNRDRIPTVRGGAKWRHSSVQAAAGYKRRRPRPPATGPRQEETAPQDQDEAAPRRV